MIFEETLADPGLLVKEREKGGRCRAAELNPPSLLHIRQIVLPSYFLKVQIDKDTPAFLRQLFQLFIIFNTVFSLSPLMFRLNPVFSLFSSKLLFRSLIIPSTVLRILCNFSKQIVQPWLPSLIYLF